LHNAFKLKLWLNEADSQSSSRESLSTIWETEYDTAEEEEEDSEDCRRFDRRETNIETAATATENAQTSNITGK
jgi:hypothetical protein